MKGKIKIISCICIVVTMIIGILLTVKNTKNMQYITESVKLSENSDKKFDIFVVPDSSEKHAGDTVKLKINAENIQMGEEGLNCVVGYLSYDDTLFEEMNVTGVNDWHFEMNRQEGHSLYGKFVAYIVSEGERENQEIAEITLKIGNDVKPQKTEISFTELKSGDENISIQAEQSYIDIEIVDEQNPDNPNNSGNHEESGNEGNSENLNNDEAENKVGEDEQEGEKINSKNKANISIKTGDIVLCFVMLLIKAVIAIFVVVVKKNRDSNTLVIGNRKKIVMLLTALAVSIGLLIAAITSFAYSDEINEIIRNLNNNESLLNSEDYLVTDEMVSRIMPNTSVQNFVTKFNKNVNVYAGYPDAEVTDGVITTGMRVSDGQGIYVTSVSGDLNGDAKCDQIDLAKVIRNIVNSTVYEFDNLEQTSADIDCNGLINKNDVDAFVRYILYEEMELAKYSKVQAPKIEVTDGTYNDAIAAYEDEILVRITKQDENTARIMYKIEGTEQKEYEQIVNGGVVALRNNGVYKISAYSYGTEGNRSEIAHEILIKKSPENTYKVTTRIENRDGTYQESTEEKTGRIGTTVTYSESIPEGYEVNGDSSTLSGTINENEILELVATLDRKMYTLRLNAGEFISSVEIDGQENASSITKSIKFGKTADISAELEAQEGYTISFERWVSSDRNILTDISTKTAQIEMPMSDIELTATASRANNEDTKYVVEYYYQTNGTYSSIADETKERRGETDATVEVTENDKIATRLGYVLDETRNSDFSGAISGDGSLELKVYFKQQFAITYNAGEHGSFKNGEEFVAQEKYDGIDYGTSTPNLQGEIIANAGYTFAGWDNEIEDTVTENKTYVAVYTVNEIEFNGATLTEGVFGTEYVSGAFDSASNGSDSYTYAIKEGAPAGASISGENGSERKLVFLDVTPAGTYNVVITAKDTVTGITKDATFVVTINKQQVERITNLEVATDGTITWTNSANATDYEISIDGTDYLPFTNGENYLNEIIASTGTRAICIKSVNSDENNYETTNDGITRAEVTVCALTVESNDINYGTVSPTTYNVISGVIFETSNNKLIVKSGDVELKCFTANTIELPGYTTIFSNWSQVSGTISESTAITAYFTRNANTYLISFNANGGTGEMSDEEMTYDVEKALTINSFTRTGYTFKGWSTTENGEEVYTDGNPVKNLVTEGTYTLWAVWKDETSPSITISNLGDTNPTPTKNVTITVSENGSGLSSENEYQYYLSNSDTGLSGGEWVEYANGTELTIGTGLNGDYYLFIKPILDKADNGSVAENSTDTTIGEIKYHRYGSYKFGQLYTIVFNSNGGNGSMSSLDMIYGVEKNLPSNTFTKDGYTFQGWSTSESGNVEYDDGKSVGDIATEGTCNLYAIWLANSDTGYHVYHYVENVDSNDSTNLENYTLNEEEELYGTTDTSVTATPKEYQGFTYDANNTNSVKEANIEGNGSLVLKLYYTRNEYEIKLLKDEYVDSVTGAGKYKYGATVTINATLDENVGSTIKFAKWQSNHTDLVAEQTTAQATFTMPAADVNLRAKINYGQKVNYSVEVNGQTLNDWELFLKEDDGYAYIIYGDYLPNAAIPSEAVTAGSLSTAGTYRVWSTQDLTTLINSLKTPEYWNSYITRELQILAQNIEKTATATGTLTAEQFKKSWNNQYTANQGQVNFTGDDTNGWSLHTLKETAGYAENESTNLYYPHKSQVSDDGVMCEGYIIASMYANNHTRSLYIGYDGATYNAGYANKDGSIRPVIKIPSDLLELSEDGTEWNIKYSSLVHEIALNSQDATTAGTTSIYEKYGIGFYLQNENGTLSSKMTTTENGITIPEKSGFTFGGYYTEENGAGTQYIDENGKLTSSAVTTNFSDAGILYAKWILNELTFENQTINKTYSTVVQAASVTPANGGTGIYTYAKVSGDDDIAVSEDGTITIPENKAVNTEGYTVVISATDSTTHATKNATYTIVIGKQTVNPVTNLAVSTAGIVTWDVSDNATGYEISLDGTNYTSFTSGSSYLTAITEIAGNKKIYVKAINTDNTNYESTDASVAESAEITVYTLTVESNNTEYGTVDAATYNVIHGATYLANGNKLTILSGSKVLKTVTATVIDETGYDTSLEGWSPDEGTIVENSLILANFIRSGKDNVKYHVQYYIEDLDGNGYTLEDTVEKQGTTATTATAELKTITGFTYDEENANNNISDTIAADGSTILKVYYKRNINTVTFDANGGTGTMPNESIRYNESKALSDNTYERKYTVTFNSDGGEISTNSLESNYTFENWSTDNSENNIVYFSDVEKNRYNDEWTYSDEFTQYVDMAPYFDTYGDNKLYNLNLDIKSENTSNNNYIDVYFLNCESSKYSFKSGKRIHEDVTTAFQNYNINEMITLSDTSQNQAMLAFYGGYNTGNYPVVRNVMFRLGACWDNGATISYEDIEKLSEESEITLYAKWKAEEIVLPTPTKSYYTFKGWYTDEYGMNKVGDGGDTYTPTEDIELYAIWEVNELTFENQTINKTYSTSSQTANVTPASNGTGTYTYAKVSGEQDITVSEEGVITIPAEKEANSDGYEIVVRATDVNSGATKDATYTIIIAE